MASRGRQTFNKRQKEQQRKEKQQEKLVRRQQRKDSPGEDSDLAILGEDGQLIDLPAGVDPTTLIESPNRLQRQETSIETLVETSKQAE